MSGRTPHPNSDVQPKLLARSDELHAKLIARLNGAEFDGSDRGEACFGMCSLSLDRTAQIRIAPIRLPHRNLQVEKLKLQLVKHAMHATRLIERK